MPSSSSSQAEPRVTRGSRESRPNWRYVATRLEITTDCSTDLRLKLDEGEADTTYWKGKGQPLHRFECWRDRAALSWKRARVLGHLSALPTTIVQSLSGRGTIAPSLFLALAWTMCVKICLKDNDQAPSRTFVYSFSVSLARNYLSWLYYGQRCVLRPFPCARVLIIATEWC